MGRVNSFTYIVGQQIVSQLWISVYHAFKNVVRNEFLCAIFTTFSMYLVNENIGKLV